MPSPIVITRPTSAFTSSASKSFRRRLMTSEIWSVLMPNSSPLSARKPPPQLLEAGGDAGVDEAVPELEHQAADDRGVDFHVQPDLAPERRRELPRKPVAVLRGQLDGRGGGGLDPALGLVDQALVLGG